MIILKNYILVSKTARYYTVVPDSRSIDKVLVVLHGYAQLAEDFIGEFNLPDDHNTLIAAPEGLSRFYSRNKIGASWMTKEDRLNEINDYVNYLDDVLSEIKSRFDLSEAEFNILGFSQGVHTAVRWFISSKYDFSRLILCSSDFPKDADMVKLRNKSSGSKLFFLQGNKDEIISQEKFSESLGFLKLNEIPFENIVFEGKHNIDKKSISAIINNKSHSS